MQLVLNLETELQDHVALGRGEGSTIRETGSINWNYRAAGSEPTQGGYGAALRGARVLAWSHIHNAEHVPHQGYGVWLEG